MSYKNLKIKIKKERGGRKEREREKRGGDKKKNPQPNVGPDFSAQCSSIVFKLSQLLLKIYFYYLCQSFTGLLG